MAIFNNYYFHDLTQKYILIFGSLFSDMKVQKIGIDKKSASMITVPVNYAAKEKYAQRMEDDPEQKRQTAIVLPRMSYQLTDISYDSERKIARNNKLTIDRDVNSKLAKQIYTPAPYQLTFTLDIVTKTLNELNQLIEQIIPAFQPDFVVKIKALDDVTFDMPISYGGLFINDSYDGDIGEDRQITATLNFTAKVYYFAPINKKNIILDVNVPIFDIPVDNDLKESVLIETFNFNAVDYPELIKKLDYRG